MPWGIATKRLSVDEHGRVLYRYKRPFLDGPADFDARGPPGAAIVA